MSSQENPRVLIVMGSPSDIPVMTEAKKVLDALGVSSRMGIYSAHRTPLRAAALAESARDQGVRAIIAGAGAAAHLAGALASRTTVPVIGVPLAATPLAGLDALLATVQMPGGFPVGTMAIGKPGAQNAAFYAAQIVSLEDPAVAEAIADWRTKKAAAAAAASDELEAAS